MTRTFAESAAAFDAKWAVIVTIEGCGDYSGIFKFCTQVPEYATSDAHYRDWFREWPPIMSEKVDFLGGLPESGELTIDLVDIDNSLTSEWRIEGNALTRLDGEITAGATTVNVESASSITAGSSVIYVGNEAMLVSAKASNQLTCTRGALGTEAQRHKDGDPVYLYIPYLRSRRMRLYVAPIDAASSSEETEYGSYFLDKFRLSDDRNSYVLSGKSQLKWLSRLCSRAPVRRFILDDLRGDNLTLRRDFDLTTSSEIETWPSSYAFLRINGKEIITVSGPNSSNRRIADRAQLGTSIQDIRAGDVFEVVYGADPEPPSGSSPSFFRFSPGQNYGGANPSSARNAGTWHKSANWIDIILCLALSSADSNDGLELNNRNNTYGAWDALPVGIGIGVPHAQIDFSAALAVRDRTPDFVFPNFFVGHEPIPFGDLITEHFLRPLGAYLSTVNGVAKIILPRMPLAGQTTIAIGSDDILQRKVGEKWAIDDLDVSQEIGEFASQIVFKFPNGAPLIIDNADFNGTYGQAGYYAHEEKPIEINVPSARLNGDGSLQFLEERGEFRLFRFRRPPWRLSFPVGYSKYNAYVGDHVAITHSDMPNLSAGTRGWTSVVGELRERGTEIDPERGLIHTWSGIFYGPNLNVGVIAPCARIVSVADAGGGSRDITVTANRYTHTDGQASGLPVTDASAFTVNDVVKLRNRNGTTVTSTAQTITNITGNVIRTNGDFGGSLTLGTGNAGQILFYAQYASAAAQQTASFVYWADQLGQTVGVSTTSPWRYAER